MPGKLEWMKLDTAAKIYPSISHSHNNTTFRLNIELLAEVQNELLQQALVKIMPRFPSFGVSLKRGLFWFYLEHNTAVPLVREDAGFPCKRLKDFINNGFLFNISYYKKNIIMECFHGLADGAGAIEFLKTLAYEYFVLCDYDMDSEGMVLDASSEAKQCELENSFLTYFEKHGEFNRLKQPLAYHIIGNALPSNNIFVTHGIMDLKEFLAAVKSRGATVSAYVSAMLIYYTYQQQNLMHKKNKLPIIISVPVDLRSIFPSETLRNFVSFVNVGMLVKKDTSFNDILQTVSQQLRDGLTEQQIHAKINKNVKYERNPFVRMIPLFVKNLLLSNTYRLFGEGCYTMLLSNLKTTRFPASMRKHIKNIYYTLGVSDLNPLNCVVVSYEDKMIITFARGIEETGITKRFFKHFSKDLGLEIEIRGNEWSGE